MRGRSFNRHTQHNQHVQHIVHANGEVTTQHEPTASYQVKPSKKMQIKRLVLAVVLIALAVGVILGIRYFVSRGLNKNPVPAVPLTVENEIATKSLAFIGGQNAQGLTEVVDNIKTTPQSEDNVTLQYISLKYYIAISDAENARTAFNNVTRLYNKETGFGDKFRDSQDTIDSLKVQVEFLESFNAQVIKNGKELPAL